MLYIIYAYLGMCWGIAKTLIHSLFQQKSAACQVQAEARSPSASRHPWPHARGPNGGRQFLGIYPPETRGNVGKYIPIPWSIWVYIGVVRICLLYPP